MRIGKKAFRKASAQESLEMEARHRKMNDKYLTDGKKLLREGDYLQASEKFWGACVQMVEVLAAKKGLELGTHRSMSEFVHALSEEHSDLDLIAHYAKANNLP